MTMNGDGTEFPDDSSWRMGRMLIVDHVLFVSVYTGNSYAEFFYMSSDAVNRVGRWIGDWQSEGLVVMGDGSLLQCEGYDETRDRYLFRHIKYLSPSEA